MSTACGHRISITGLRGFAILMVILFHYSSLGGGFVGVDVFFVISGFLITKIILKSLEQSEFSFFDFYGKRVRRIFPAMIIVLFSCLLFSWLESDTGHFKMVGKHFESAALFISNISYFSEAGYFNSAAETKPLLHLWSLAIEEQFYLIWPVVLMIGFRFRKYLGHILGLLVVASFLSSLIEAKLNPDLDFYMLSTRFWELGLGGLAVLGFEKMPNSFRRFVNLNSVQIFGFLLILGSGLTFNGQMDFPGWIALIPVLGALTLLVAEETSILGRSLLSSKFLVFLGKISFPLYLWHWPLFSFLKMICLNEPTALQKIMAALVSIGLAVITHELIERPIIQIPMSRQNSRRFVYSGLATVLIMAGLGYSVKTGLLKSNLNYHDLSPQVEESTVTSCTFNANYGSQFDRKNFDNCSKPKFVNKPSVYLIGDSHAGALVHGLDAFAQAHQFNLVSFTAMYCTPLSLKDLRPACRDFNEYIIGKIRTDKPELVVVSAYHLKWSKDEAYSEPMAYPSFLVGELSKIQQAGFSRVLLVGQNPTWNISLPRVLNVAFLKKGLAVPERSFLGLVEDSVIYDGLMKSEAQNSNINYYSLHDQFCNSDGCLVRVGPRLPQDLVDFDYGHLSHAASLFVANNGLGPEILRFLGLEHQDLPSLKDKAQKT